MTKFLPYDFLCNLNFLNGAKLKTYTAQKMNFSKCDQIRSFQRIWSHLLKKSLMENFIFCAVLRLYRRAFCQKFSLKNLIWKTSYFPLFSVELIFN